MKALQITTILLVLAGILLNASQVSKLAVQIQKLSDRQDELDHRVLKIEQKSK